MVYSAAQSIGLTDACQHAKKILPLQLRGQQQACGSRGKFSRSYLGDWLYLVQRGGGDRCSIPLALRLTSITQVQRISSVLLIRQKTKHTACIEADQAQSKTIDTSCENRTRSNMYADFQCSLADLYLCGDCYSIQVLDPLINLHRRRRGAERGWSTFVPALRWKDACPAVLEMAILSVLVMFPSWRLLEGPDVWCEIVLTPGPKRARAERY